MVVGFVDRATRGVLAAALVWMVAATLTGCSPTGAGGTDPSPVTAELALVDPDIVVGLTSAVEENLEPGRFTYLTFPVVPGADGWTDAMRDALAPQVERFGELAAGTDEPPLPELQVAWDLVGASPEAIGARLVTSVLGEDDTFEGKVETSWWDPATGTARSPLDLIDRSAEVEFFSRLRAAAEADPRVIPERYTNQISGEWEAFRSVAFTTDGELWIEFARDNIADTGEPVGLAVDPAGLLTPFGEAAQRAALDPSDPDLEPVPEPTPEPTPTPTTDPGGGTGGVDCAVAKCAALTFDDGPVSGTNDLLDVLAARGAPATFFVVGSNVENHPEIMRRMVAEGHAVGNHTKDHPQLTRLDAGAIRRELTETDDAIEVATGQRPTILRPPYGAYNETVSRVAGELGMSLVLWNVDPEDWKDRDSAVVARRVLAQTRNGSIVLSHDIHPSTREAYAAIVDGLLAEGFTLVTVPQLFGGQLQPGRVYSAR